MRTRPERGYGSEVRHLPPRAAVLLASSLAIALTGTVVALARPAPTRQPPPLEKGLAQPLAQPTVEPPAKPVVVAALRAPVVPDLLLSLTHPMTPSQLVAVRRIKGVTAVSSLARGNVHIGHRTLQALGVDPSTFRPFTPGVTAASDALWRSVAAGEIAGSYATALPLGSTIDVVGRTRFAARLGATADFGLPNAQVVLEVGRAKALGLRVTSLLLAAPDRSVKRLIAELRAALGDVSAVQVLRPVKVTFRRPSTYRELYMLSAGYCPGLSWKVLAAIGQVESGHGRNVGPSSAGALGPMQFLPSTWAYAGVDGDGDGRADIMSAYDAVPAAALYLCRDGGGHGGQDLYDAIFSYNHSDDYVRTVLALAEQYK